MLEGAVNGVAGMLGERNPQLHTVQNRGRGRRRLGMANAVAGGHEVHLAGAYQTAAPVGVHVGNLALEQPRHRLQPNVWVRGNVHPAGACHVIWDRNGRQNTRPQSWGAACAEWSGAPSSRAGHRVAPRGTK